MKNVQLNVRISAEENERIKQAQQASGLSMAEFIVARCLPRNVIRSAEDVPRALEAAKHAEAAQRRAYIGPISKEQTAGRKPKGPAR